MITLRKNNPSDKLIELGGGANPTIRPNVDVRMCCDQNGNPTVDFTANFEEPLPISSNEFDGVYSHFVLEHISWRKVEQFLRELLRILKPGGKVVLVTANTEAQIRWVLERRKWDHHSSCILFGDQDYPENTHKNFQSPDYIKEQLVSVGFENIRVTPYGDLATDMVVEASKPMKPLLNKSAKEVNWDDPKERKSLFDFDYFNGGRKVGGYAREGYWDFPVHNITAEKIIQHKPTYALELGCGRGYILKRLQDNGINAWGMEISKHCIMTRVCDQIKPWDLCITPWPFSDGIFDLCYSVAVLEHIPEQYINDVKRELRRVCTDDCTFIHGVDLGEKDDGFDKTHVTLRPLQWWKEQGVLGVIDKEELEKGPINQSILRGDGKVKLNIGSFTTMFHHGWVNIDIHDLAMFAGHYGYNFQRLDVRSGLPYSTGSVDMIYTSHFLEHLSYKEGASFLRECRRVLKKDGVIRVIVPDYDTIQDSFPGKIREFDEINSDCKNANSDLERLWILLNSNHQSMYRLSNLYDVLNDCGFTPFISEFREELDTSYKVVESFVQMKKETLDVLPCLSLYMNAVV